MPEPRNSVLRLVLGALLLLVAVNAVAGGVYGISGADDVPTEWLQGTPFSDYLVPSWILLVAVGSSSLVAAIAVLGRFRWARPAALGAGAVLAGWMAAQLAIIGYVSWMQPTFVVVAVVVLGIAAALAKSS